MQSARKPPPPRPTLRNNTFVDMWLVLNRVIVDRKQKNGCSEAWRDISVLLRIHINLSSKLGARYDYDLQWSN